MISKLLCGGCLVLGSLVGSAGSAMAQENDSSGFFPSGWGPEDKLHMFIQATDLLQRASMQPWLFTGLEIYNRGWDGLIQTVLWSPTIPITGKWPNDKFPWSEFVCRTIASNERWYTLIPFGF